MAVIEDLTDEECALYAILTDESGIDLAEFTWLDEDKDDGCFRLWAFQWKWWRCVDPLQIDQAARSVGKSMSILARACAFPHVHPGNEMVITAPEGVHLDAITDKIETTMLSTRIGTEMLKGGRLSFRHKPFHCNFKNGARVMGRIPQRDGKGVKGIHPIWLELDEAQDYPDQGWTELNETLKRGQPGAVWRAHGVTRGVRDKFYKYTADPNSNWTVHRWTAMHRPTWSDAERKEKIEQYGGRDDPDYRRNILGSHGDSVSPLFVISRLFVCIDDDKGSDYNVEEYVNYQISDSYLQEMGLDILEILDFPGSHFTKYKRFWMGMDVGMCVDEETQIFTRRGWLGWKEIQAGDETLAINPATGASEWTLVDTVNVFDEREREVMHFKGQSFDALTTPNHRWLVRSESGVLRWKTSETLNSKDRIPLTTGRADAPREETYEDDFVELVAWYSTEGSRQARYAQKAICQSETANPALVERIRSCLRRLYGDSGPVPPGPYRPSSAPQWSEKSRFFSQTNKKASSSLMTYFYLSKPIADRLEAVAPGSSKAVSIEFLSSLTLRQLDLFIDVSILGDGWITKAGHRKIEQASFERVHSFEAACALAGYATSTTWQANVWHISVLRASSVCPVAASRLPRKSSQAMTVTQGTHPGIVWCPSLSHGNWLARRNGSVYFTGNTNHPSEILVFAEDKPHGAEETQRKRLGKAMPPPGMSQLKLISRIGMRRVSSPDQTKAILWLIDRYKPQAFSMDKTGLGLPMFQELQDRNRQAGTIIKGYGFSEKILVDFDQTVEVDAYATQEEVAKEAGILRNTVEYATDKLRQLVDTQRIYLPWDEDLIGEFQGQTYRITKTAMNQYGRREYSQGKFHALDAARMAVLGYIQYGIEDLMKRTQDAPVIDAFMLL